MGRDIQPVRDLEVVEIEDCYGKKETQKGKSDEGALLVVLPNGDEEWIPKSQIHEDSEVYKEGTDGKLIVAKFIADKITSDVERKVRWIGP